MENSIPLVSIVCITYNHEPFISQCIEGFLMQKTNFKFEILINDDASTDKTQDIIKEYESKYPDIIKPIYQTENQYSKGVHPWFDILFPIAKGKYIALCDGDDYWTDPLKLQKQVDFLESNDKYSVCCHLYSELYDIELKERYSPYKYINKTVIEEYHSTPFVKFNRDDNLNTWLTQPLTAVFRRDIVFDIPCSYFQYFRDIHLFYYILSYGLGALLLIKSGIYRKHEGGIYSSVENKLKSKVKLMFEVYNDLFLLNKSDKCLFIKKLSYENIYFLLCYKFKDFLITLIQLFKETKFNTYFFNHLRKCLVLMVKLILKRN